MTLEEGESDSPTLSPPSSSAELTVRVLTTEEDEPIPGLVVSVFFSLEEERETRTETTDEQGLALFSLAHRTQVISVRAGSMGTTVPTIQYPRLVLLAGQTKDLVLRCGSGHSLRGRVLDDQDRPVADAEVLGWLSRRMSGEPQRSTRSASEGTFTLSHLGPRFIVEARHPDYASLEGLRGELSADAQGEDMVLRLGPPGSLSGVVLDPTRAPVSNARVWVTNGLSSSSSRDRTSIAGVSRFRAGKAEEQTDSQGRFQLKGLPRRNLYLQVQQEPYLVYRSYHQLDDSPVEVVLDPGLQLTRYVLDAVGEMEFLLLVQG